MSPVASACHLPLSLFASAGGTGGASVGSAPSSFVASNGPLFAVSGRPLSLVAGDSPLSTVSSHLSSSITGGDPSSTVSSRFSSSVADSGLLSTFSGGGPLFSIPPAGSRTLYLTSTLFYAHCSSLPSSPLFHSSLPSLLTALACNPIPFTGKRLFDQAFITQRPIASRQ